MLVSIPAGLGYPALAGLIFGESAGLPLPGETALISAGALAAAGHLSLPLVILAATLAAISGDTLGYVLGRRHGRSLLLRGGFMAHHRRKAVARADRFFARRGAVAVLVSRFVPGVRVVAAVMAGATQMPYRRFALANTAGAVLWASTIGTLAYALGPAGGASLALAGVALGPIVVGTAWVRSRFTGAAQRAHPTT